MIVPDTDLLTASPGDFVFIQGKRCLVLQAEKPGNMRALLLLREDPLGLFRLVASAVGGGCYLDFKAFIPHPTTAQIFDALERFWKIIPGVLV